MITTDVIYLKCIKCGSVLSLKAFKMLKKHAVAAKASGPGESEDCEEGILKCTGCKEEYPIIKGIPRLLPDELMAELVYSSYAGFFKRYHIKVPAVAKKAERLKARTADTFGFEWKAYKSILSQFESDWARYFSPYIKKSDIPGKVVADIGCGMAKHGYFTAKYAAKKYIGVDLSEAVESAYANTRQFKSLIVQADIYHLPLDGKRIDLFYSIGVLHHLPDPAGGFQSIAKIMKNGSQLFIWVYSKHKNLRALLLYNPIRVITTRMPKKVLYTACHAPAILLHAINLGYIGAKKAGFKRLAELFPFKYYAKFPYKFKVSDSFDVFGTPKQVYYDKKDIARWFKKAQISKFTLTYDQVQGIKGFGIKR